MTERVIVLVDMDCFYCQVETKLNPTLAGKPVAVVQYNAWKGGGIIAVNYEARDKGVTRFMRGDDAKAACPEIQLVSVPTIRDKADLTKYRDASRDVIAVLCTYSDCVERASIDEAYLDLTETVRSKGLDDQVEPFQISNTFVVGYSKEKCNDETERDHGTIEWLKDIYSSFSDEASKNLAIASKIVEEIRAEVFSKTGFRCSAGIAHNKILAKLACGLHKPNRQTILPHSSVPHLYKTLSIKNVRHLGGKLGDLVMEKLDCSVMADLLQYSEKDLKLKFDAKNGSWLYNIARGIDSEPVKSRLVTKSIGCCKRFPGKTALKSKDDICYWLNQLADELTERILEDQTMNKRKAQLLTVSLTLPHHQAVSKAITLSFYDKKKIFNSAFLAVRKICSNSKEETWIPVFCLGLSASKFSDLPSTGAIENYFHATSSKTSFDDVKKPISEEAPSCSSFEKESPSNSFFSKFIKKSTPDKASSSCKENLESLNDVSSRIGFLQDNDCKAGLITCTENSNVPAEENIISYIPEVSLNDSVSSPKKNLKQVNSGNETDAMLKPSKTETMFETPLVKTSSTAKKKDKAIEFFFKNQNECEIVNPLDVFPDLNAIDDEMLQNFPFSFRRKVLALKKEYEMNKVTNTNSFKKYSPERTADQKNLSDNEQVKLVDEGSKDSPRHEVKDCDCIDIFEHSNYGTISSNEPTGNVSKYFSNNLEACPECGKQFEADNLPEHLDFHVAQRINLEINSASFSNQVSMGVTNTGVSAKRKQSGRGKKISNSKKCKTLETFFAL